MLECDRKDISEGIDVNKTSLSKECDNCHYWYFKDIGFKYETYLCNGCHDLKQKAMSFNDVAIIYVKGSAYRIHLWCMSKNDGISLTSSSNLIDKKGVLYIFFYYVWKMSEKTYYQRNRDGIPNRVKDYNENEMIKKD